jgi:hypothetical protein
MDRQAAWIVVYELRAGVHTASSSGWHLCVRSMRLSPRQGHLAGASAWPQVCGAACSLMCRIPDAFTASRQYRDSTPGAYGCPISLLSMYSQEPRLAPRASRSAAWRTLADLRTVTSRWGRGSVRREVSDLGSFSTERAPAATLLLVIARVFLSSQHRTIAGQRFPHAATRTAPAPRHG